MCFRLLGFKGFKGVEISGFGFSGLGLTRASRGGGGLSEVL